MGGATGGWAVEYAVKTGSAEWNVTSGQSQLTGVTQVTKCTRYEADATSTAQQDSPCGLNTHVAHFGFPVELELEAQHSPEPSQWPTVYFQVRVGARGRVASRWSWSWRRSTRRNPASGPPCTRTVVWCCPPLSPHSPHVSLQLGTLLTPRGTCPPPRAGGVIRPVGPIPHAGKSSLGDSFFW